MRNSELGKSDANYLPNYESVMNYLYQWSIGDYSEKTASSKDPRSSKADCTTNACYDKDYTVPADWTSLNFKLGNFGVGADSIGGVMPTFAPAAPPIATVAPSEPTGPDQPSGTDKPDPGEHNEATNVELERAAAHTDALAGKGAIYVDSYELVKARGDNYVKVGIRNFGATDNSNEVYVFLPVDRAMADHVQNLASPDRTIPREVIQATDAQPVLDFSQNSTSAPKSTAATTTTGAPARPTTSVAPVEPSMSGAAPTSTPATTANSEPSEFDPMSILWGIIASPVVGNLVP
ncbi:MAG: hypothetical protein SPI77_00555 [Corynebacterium sp.]|nr:hypothetical protein [Corynebacterium sp.]